ncbi:MAG TPA: regulatory iron-sulfur-containing complex subunit RicT [Chitinophagales bacterium]|jgi:cell fate regulator YaaT (PSP1 superfamily)|nr:regulatory iron-sulfur-containing complex subunit RicT [Chitinophagales bacterium]
MSCNSCGTTSTPGGCKNNGHCATGGCSKLEVHDWLSDITADPYAKYNIHEVSFKNGSRKGFYRNDKRFDVFTGDYVIVEAVQGYDLGQVTLSGELVRLQMKRKRVKENSEDIRSILRIAKDNELNLMEQARAKEKQTMLKARVLARNLGLDMKLGDVQYQADGKKATFYYTADGRVDFRELIKVLASEFKVKIEMRQIGARQEAGIVGGIGSCGRELCCSTWLTSFKSVNTTAARYQNLSINQTKLSGQCGRLKCCLNYELDTYLDALRFVPERAETLQLETGDARLMKTDILKGLMFYTVKGSGTFYPISLENVKMVLEMNANGKKPADITDLAEAEEKTAEESIEFADVVGQITLASLDRKDKKNFHKNKQQGSPRNQSNQQNRPQQNNQKQQGAQQKPANQQQQNRPQNNQNRPNKNRPPRPNNQGKPNNNPNKDNPPKE